MSSLNYFWIEITKYNFLLISRRKYLWNINLLSDDEIDLDGILSIVKNNEFNKSFPRN